MIVVFIRSIILYISVLIALRVMGKGEIAEMNSFDLVITLLIAEVASIPMENNNIPLTYGIASITGLVLMQTLISYFSLKNRKISTLLCGKPSILINKGYVDYKELKKERISINELLEQLRVQGYFNLAHVQYAILETDGNLSIVPSPTYNATPSKQFKHLPMPLILDGKVVNENLSLINKDLNWLLGILKSHHLTKPSEVLICILDENDKIFIQPRKI